MTFNSLLALSLSVSLLMACTGGTSDPVKPHEIDVPETSMQSPGKLENGGTPSASPSPALVKLATLEGEALFNEGQSHFLDFKNWENQSQSFLADFKKFIHDFQREAIARFEKIERTNYIRFFQNFCDADLKNCKHLPTLKSTPYSSAFLTRLAAGETDFSTRFRINLLALECSNQVPNQEAAILFMKDLKQAKQEFSKSGQNALLSQINSYSQLIFTNAQSGILKISPEFLSQSIDLLEIGESSQLELAGQLYVKDGKPTELLGAKLQELNEKPNSYAKKFEWMEKSAPHFITQLKVTKLDYDAYFFILEQVVQRNWTSKQASAFFKGSALSIETFQQRAKVYANNIVAYIIAAIQSDLFNGYKASDKKDRNRFFYDGSVSISMRINEARSLVDQFRALVSLEDTLGGNRSSGMRQIVESLPETFRLAVSDAVTFSLLDRGLKLDVGGFEYLPLLASDFSERITFIGVFLDFLTGTMEPLIQVLPIQPHQHYFSTYEALEFAIRTNFFGVEPDAADKALTRFLNFYLQIDAYSPTKSVPAEAVQTRMSTINQSLKNLRALRTNTTFRFVTSQCATMDQQGLQSHFDLLDMKFSPLIGKALRELKASKLASTSAGRLYYPVFPTESLHSASLEWGRLDLLPRLEQMLAVTKSIEADTNLRFPTFNLLAQNIKNALGEVYEQQLNLFRNYLPCWYKHMINDRTVTAQLVKYDHAFWKWAVQPENREKANSLFLKDLPENLKYRTQIKNDGILIYNFDLLIRTRHYLAHGLPFLNLPPLAPGVKIRAGQGTEKEPPFTNATMISVQFEENLEKTALTALRASGFKFENSVVEWYGLAYIPTSELHQLLEVTSSLYRIGPFAKKHLGVKSIYSLDELLKDNQDIYRYLNLSKVESEALALLGEIKRFKSTGKIETPFLFDDMGGFIPITETLNKSLISPWTGTFANAELWENPKENNNTVRPPSLIPFQRLAKTYKTFLTDRKSNLFHLFKDNLKSPPLVEAYLRDVFKMELEVRQAAIEPLKKTAPFKIQLKVDEVVETPGFNGFHVDDLRNHIEEFKKDMP